MKCKTCGKNAESEYCFLHKPRKPMPTSTTLFQRKNVKFLHKNRMKTDNSSKILHQFFLELWKKRRHYSEVSGKYLGEEPLSVFFHHILPKNKYQNFWLDEENIIFLTLEEHDQVEMDIYRYEEINNRRKYLIEKYERAQQRTQE